jgi:hypothetical protein
MNPSIEFSVTFRDFQALQGYMARRMAVKAKGAYTTALLGVVACAVMLAATIVTVSQSYRLYGTNFLGLGYPANFYALLDLLLVIAVACLYPAVRLRLRTLRMQVSDDGPLLGATKLTIAEDGLILEKPAVVSKYAWRAFQAVEFAKDAIILPVDNGIGLIVPPTAFASAAARLEFAAAVSKKIEEARQAKR